MKFQKSSILSVLFVFLISACSQSENQSRSEDQSDTIAQQTEDWQLLIQDGSTAGWHNYLGDSVSGWQVEEGVLYTLGGNGDIVTDAIYENFELSLEWKIEEQGNSGIFFHVVESPEHARMYETGPEFQIIDDQKYPAELTEQQKTGALSDVIAPDKAAANPVGSWNHTRIVVDKHQVEHWLNEVKILEYQLGSEQLKTQINASKFADLPYAKVQSGRIGLQDHGSPVYYKNIKIKVL